MQIDLLCPVENQGVTVKTNSKTGEPYALLKLFNLSRRMIDSVSFIVRVYDANGGALGEAHYSRVFGGYVRRGRTLC